MTTLAATQEAFLASVLDDDLPMPDGWGARHGVGLAIYRNNYRSALVEALRSTFERTERLVGEDAFRRAAAHHCIAHPPTGWTLDVVGEGFDRTCADLFANDPDVAELAWLEWTMHRAFTVADIDPLDGEGFAAAANAFGENDWADLRLDFVPSLSQRTIAFDLKRLWSSLAEDGEADVAQVDRPCDCVVWREGERPVFILVPQAEAAALAAMRDGASYGEGCAIAIEALGEEAGIAAAGEMLGRWLREGWIARLAR